MTHAATSAIRVVIADENPDQMARTLSLLRGDRDMVVVGTAGDPSAALALLDEEPDVVLLASSLARDATPTLVRRITEYAPYTNVLLITHNVSPAEMSRAALSGARGVLSWPLGGDELLRTVREVYISDANRRQRQRELEAQRETQPGRGRVILVFSPKGGVGCSLLACNAAVALQAATGKSVALVDYSLQFGTVGAIMDVQTVHHVGELVGQYDAIDSTILEHVMAPHSSGVQLLLAPANPDHADGIDTTRMIGILEGVRAAFDYVVVDTCHTIEDCTLALMEAADVILLVTTPEAPALHTVARLLRELQTHAHLRHRLQLVVNRHPSRGGMPLDEIERRLGLQAVATLPSDGGAMTLAINEGVSALQRNALSATGRGFAQLAEALITPADRPGPPGAPRGVLNLTRRPSYS
jgi:pilus assembly protein CpaE